MIYTNDLDIIQASENVAIGVGSLQSSAAPTGSVYARVAANGACHIRLDGPNPTAAATDFFLPANLSFIIRIGVGHKVAVIQDGAATGNLNVTFLRG